MSETQTRLAMFTKALAQKDWTGALCDAYNPIGNGPSYDEAKAALVLDLREALAARNVPDGWVAVPREPTKDELAAVRERFVGWSGSPFDAFLVGRRTALAAAPSIASTEHAGAAEGVAELYQKVCDCFHDQPYGESAKQRLRGLLTTHPEPVAWTNQDALDVVAMRGADTPYEQPMWSDPSPDHDIALSRASPIQSEVGVTDEEFAALLDALSNPAPPTESIKTAAKLLRQLYGASHAPR